MILRVRAATEREPLEVVGKRGLAVEILDQPALPGGREVEAFDQSRKERDVAHTNVGRIKPVAGGRFERERDGLGVGRRGVGAAEGFDAGLHQFGRARAEVAKHRAQIAVFRRFSGGGRRQIVAGNRDRQVGPQAEFGVGGIGDQEHAAADVLAREVEERLGRLQDRWLHAHVTGKLVGRDQRVGACIRLSWCRHG